MENVWVMRGRSPREHGQVRVIVYEYRNGKEEVFELPTVEDEQHERAQAERELHSRDTQVTSYRFEWR